MLFSCHSMSSYLHSRPPFSLFVLSLVSLSLTSFALALYCHTSSNLPNTDVLDWHKLLSQLSRFKAQSHTAPPASQRSARRAVGPLTSLRVWRAMFDRGQDLYRVWPE